MNFLKQFSIPFVGLKQGKHQFEYNISKAFFDEFDYSPIKQGDLKITLELQKQETMMVLTFALNGKVTLTCDRCNEEFEWDIHSDERVLLKMSEEDYDTSDEIVTLSKNDYEINVANFIYEFINLAVPIVHIHPDLENGEPGCNKEVLKIIKKLSVSEQSDSKTIVQHDPRWDALKKLREN